MKSWKIGAISGLIAVIIIRLLTVSVVVFSPLNFLYFWIPSEMIIRKIPVETSIGIIWGIVSGIIYSKIYDLIPGRSILKAIIFGLGIYLILNVRGATFSIFYSRIQEAILGLVQIWFWTVFGLVLGISYEFLLRRYSVKKKKLKIIRPDLRNGIHPGAIAGFFGGIGVFILNIIIFNRELFPYMTDISFLISQMGTHAFFNMIWGIVFGIFFVMFYEKIPGKGISKGMVYCIIIFFLTPFLLGLGEIAYGEPMRGYWYCIGGFTNFFIFGIIIGALYKPTK
jgi:hypothetical protein